MPMQPRPIATSMAIPEPDRLVKATTGQQSPIRAPGHCPHPVCMSCQRLAQAEASYAPQPYSGIPASAGQLCAIRGKGQSQHPVCMPYEHPPGAFWLLPRELPQSNALIGAPNGEQAPIGTPGQREHRAALTGERLAVRAGCRVPELDGGIISTAGERASIWSKGQAFDVVGEPACPEQGTALDV